LGAVRLAFRAELRRRWRSWLAVAILVSIVGGLVLAAAAAGRRTESAFPQFVSAHGYDTIVFATRPVPTVGTLPDVTATKELVVIDTGRPTCDCAHQINPTDFGVGYSSTSGRSLFALISGHLPDPSAPDQVLASISLRQDYGVHLGTVIHVPLYRASQASAYNNATGAEPGPQGSTVALRVVGFEASELEFPAGTAPQYTLYVSQAFARTVMPRAAVAYTYFARLRHGVADLRRFEAAASTLKLGTGSVGYTSEDALAASIEASIHPQSIGWWILAALAALVGLAVVGQALARQSIVESEDYPTMAALGLDRRQLFALGTTRNLVVALAGAAGALAVAVALSPIAPLGEARLAEASTGFAFDALILPLGALATVAVVLALGLWPTARAIRASRANEGTGGSRPSVIVTQLAAAGASPSAVVGVRNALERRSGGGTVPVGSALLGTVLAVVALCGTGVFGASLSHLTATPKLYGDPFQLSFNPNGGPPDPTLLGSLERDKAIASITRGAGGGQILINKVDVGAIAAAPIRGRLLISVVAGHPPNGVGQIGLGAATMRRVGAHLGSIVHVTLQGHAARFHVVSQISFPVLAGGTVYLGTGALITISGLEAVLCPAGAGQTACRQGVVGPTSGGVLASVVSGPRGQAAITHYLRADASIATLPITPTSLINFGEAVNFPLIFGAMLAVFGAATLAHLLIVSVSRRRREIGLLKMLGFVNGQVASAVAWQATTLALVGIVIGVPIGVVLGEAVWRAFANNLGAVPVAVVPVLLTAVLAAGVVIVANLIAVVPALVATRSKPGDLLRAS
jgi:hypothetical protein